MYRLLCLLLLMIALGLPAHAQETDPVAPLPGVAEVIPRASQLAEQGTKAAASINALKDTSAFVAQIAESRKRQEELNQWLAGLGEPAAWSLDRLLEARGRVAAQKDGLKRLLESLSVPLATLDGIRVDWSEKQAFLQAWQASLTGPGLEVPADIFEGARRTVASTLEGIGSVSASYVTLQQEVTALTEKNQESLLQIDASLSALRKETFKKTARSLLSRDFYRQFNEELWGGVKSGVTAVLGGRAEFLQQQGWIIALQVLLAAALAGFIRHHRHVAEEAEDWQFILRHPWATGIFVSLTALSFLYSTPPALWRLALWTLAAYAASVLISGLLRNPRKIFMVGLLATLFVVSLLLQIVSLPTPLYRLYMVCLALAGMPLLLLMAASNVRAHAGKVNGFTLALRAGAAVLFVSFAAQLGGFSTLASRLVESSIQTVFLGLFAAMAVRLGRGGLDFALGQEVLRRWRFFRRFGSDLAARLKGLLQFAIYAYAAFYLLEIWGIYDTLGQAWSDLLDLGFTWGETEVSVRMVLLAALVLYLSIVVSWVLRSLLETEFFPRRHLDRGVRDSIKKLLHYTLVLVGFLLAMGLAGFDLQNFVVLAGAFGIGIGFGLQNIVNNFVSGLILLFERPIKVGDVVVIDGEWGTIKKIGLRSTVVETWDRAEIIVPNSQLISEKVTNWTLTTPVARISIPVGVAYGSDVPLVLKILKEAGDEHPDVLQDPPPSPLFSGFGESSLDFELRVWIGDVNGRLKIKSDLAQYVDRRFREEGVEIPFPQRDLHLRSVDDKVLRAQSKVPGMEE